jgi:hypothetical protein
VALPESAILFHATAPRVLDFVIQSGLDIANVFAQVTGWGVRHLTTHSTGLANRRSFINNVGGSPVNSGVRTAGGLRHATGRHNLPSGMPQPVCGLTTHSTGLAISLTVILNLNCSPVNSGVRRLTYWSNT